MTARQVPVHGIGLVAAQVLASGPALRVAGTTSRGVFLRTVGRWIVFLSFETHLSPLTVALGPGGEALKAVAPGDPVRCADGRIEFHDRKLYVSFSGLSPWVPPAPLHASTALSQQVARWRELAAEVSAARPAGGRSTLLGQLHLLDAPMRKRAGGREVDNPLSRLRRAMREGDASGVASECTAFLGQGPGLTPSGDDLVVGILLALHRWPGAPWDPARRAGITEEIVPAAYSATSTLGANLIECASAGGADERLLQAVDHLWSGHPSRTTALEGLRDWGSTSGSDALAGMGLVLGIDTSSLVGG